jgi:hypothetical protein
MARGGKTKEGKCHLCGNVGPLSFEHVPPQGASSKVVSELVTRPFGYVLTFSSRAPDDRLVDISFFADSLEAEVKEFSLPLPMLPVYSKFPGEERNGQPPTQRTLRGPSLLVPRHHRPPDPSGYSNCCCNLLVTPARSSRVPRQPEATEALVPEEALSPIA